MTKRKTGELVFLREDCWMIAGERGIKVIFEPKGEPPTKAEEYNEWLAELTEAAPQNTGSIFQYRDEGNALTFENDELDFPADGLFGPAAPGWKIYRKGDAVGLVVNDDEDYLSLHLIGSQKVARFAKDKMRRIAGKRWFDEGDEGGDYLRECFVNPDDVLGAANETSPEGVPGDVSPAGRRLGC